MARVVADHDVDEDHVEEQQVGVTPPKPPRQAVFFFFCAESRLCSFYTRMLLFLSLIFGFELRSGPPPTWPSDLSAGLTPPHPHTLAMLDRGYEHGQSVGGRQSGEGGR